MRTSRNIRQAVAAVFVMTVAASPVFASDAPVRERSLDREIQACVAEVGKRANYDDAARVVHQVVEATQKNLAEQEFKIDTAIYSDDDAIALRAYSSTCVTMGPIKVVRFRINEVESQEYAAAL